MQIVVWFNNSLSVIAEAIQALRSKETTVDKIIVTHKNKFFHGLHLADFAQVEDSDVSADEYVPWALEFAKEHGVTHFFVGRFAYEVSLKAREFEAIGVTLMLSVLPENWDDIDDKARFYRRLEQAGLSHLLPIWNTWNDGYRQSLRELTSDVETGYSQARKSCVKPVRGIFGQGFFRFDDHPDPGQQVHFPEHKVIEVSRFAELASEAARNKGKHSDWMVMEYLPGPEYSVDTLAYHGKLVTYVARQKGSISLDGQQIVHAAEIEQALRDLAREFKITGVFNAQFRRDVEGNLKALEINPRFSGGMGLSMQAGVNLPAWWINVMVTNGHAASDAPQALVGMRVYSWHHAVALYDHSLPNSQVRGE